MFKVNLNSYVIISFYKFTSKTLENTLKKSLEKSFNIENH